MDKIITCPYCHKEIKRGNGYHIKRCQDEYIRKLTDEEKERFYRLYVTEQRSLVELSKIFGIKYSNLQKILSKIGIPLRSLKEAANTPRRKELYEDTMMKHFGTKHNFDKNNPSRKKWEKRLLDEEGITNVFQRKEVIEKIHNTMTLIIISKNMAKIKAFPNGKGFVMKKVNQTEKNIMLKNMVKKKDVKDG